MADLIIRNGTIIDGTGSPGAVGDVEITEGVITAVGEVTGSAARELDAEGALVTPGFIDIHTHFDGQATWDPVMAPSSLHGVTTIAMGNCGVGFAPVRPGREQWLIELMEGVEDIPGAALVEGISWGWETIPEYLDVLDGRRWAADVAVQVPHGAVRGYVMGDRGARNEAATPDDVAEMSRIVREAVEAGALGFTTSRTLGHLAKDGSPVPGTFADADELFSIARATAAGGGRIFEVAGAGIVPADDPSVVAGEVDWMGRLAAETGLTTTFIILQHDQDPTRWRAEMDQARAWRERGARVLPLVAGRPFGVLLGWDVRHPFRLRPTYRSLAHLPLPERIEQLRRPEVKAAILAEADQGDDERDMLSQAGISFILPRCTVLDEAVDYEPTADARLGAVAERAGCSVEEAAYDALVGGDGRNMLLLALFNYADGDHEALREQLDDPDAVLGLDDGGAHCGAICDASIPTFMLTHWVRDRARGPRLGLEDTIRRLTSQPADLYGFTDRGRIAPGLRADLNVIDLDGLTLERPRAVADLPAGGIRLLQGASGYRATVVAGEVTRREGVDTGARPGRLVRG